MTEHDVKHFFDGYANAFSRSAAAEICEHWAYPAFFSARGQSASLNREDFEANTEALCGFYQSQGVARVEKTVVSFVPLTRTIASATVTYRLYDREDKKIAGWDHIYLLSETAEGIKAVVALPDQELDAWTARGTPLGQW